MSEAKKLVLIDGNSITYRAFFALPMEMQTSKGQYTNAVFGFTRMLLKLLEDEKPTHLMVAFDKGKANFRHDLYTEYKGTREKTPNELREQFPLVHEVLAAFGIPIIEIAGYEADDIIGTLAKQAEADGYETLVVTGDKDLLQLVSDRVTTMLTRKGITETEKYGVAEVAARYDGLKPEQIIDLKGLMGDTSDNIPGIPGVGEKTALKLLNLYPTVEEVLDHIDEAPGKKLQEKLREHQDMALLSKQLATIKLDVPVDEQVETFTFSGYDVAKVRDVFKNLEFRSLLKDLPAGEGAEAEEEEAAPAKERVPVETITIDRLQDVFATLPEAVGMYLDLEGNYQFGDFYGLAIATEEQAYYLTLGELLPNELVGLLRDDSKTKIFYDVKACAAALKKHYVDLDDNTFCTLLGSYLLNPSDGAPDLYDVIEREIGWKVAPLPKSTPKNKAEISLEQRAEHAGAIAAANVLLRQQLSHKLDHNDLISLYRDLELPLSFVLAEMEATGVRINIEELKEIGQSLSERIEKLQANIYEEAGVEFNLNSPKQLGEVLFEKLGLPPSKKTKTGYSTSADVLEKLAPHSNVVTNILEYRHLGKLNSTYVEGLLQAAREKDGLHRVHTQFNQALTATGRLSSTEPNLQNIPIRTEEGRRLRHAFVPSEAGWKILAADYSQIELRILAHVAGDENMIDAFVHDQDIHTRTAADIFEVEPEAVDSNMRRAAKAVNFGIVYGISDFGLSQNLNIPRKQAAQFIESYFTKFSGVKRWMEEIVKQARNDGYVTTLLGRKRYLPDITASNFNIRSFAERTAMNTPIQGTAADIIKKAMVNIADALQRENLRTRMLLQVHDELIFEAPEEELDALHELVRREMEQVVMLSVPLKADINIGDTWYEAK